MEYQKYLSTLPVIDYKNLRQLSSYSKKARHIYTKEKLQIRDYHVIDIQANPNEPTHSSFAVRYDGNNENIVIAVWD